MLFREVEVATGSENRCSAAKPSHRGNYTMKYIKIIKDLFLVIAEYKDNGQRVSEAMLAGSAGVIAGILVATGVVPLGMESETTTIVLGACTALWNLVFMVIRLRSDGGKIKLRDDIKPSNDGDSVADEHATAITDNDDPHY